MVSEDILERACQTSCYVNQPHDRVERRVEQKRFIVVIIVGKFQSYSLVHNTYHKAIRNENKQTKDKEDAVRRKPKQYWYCG